MSKISKKLVPPKVEVLAATEEATPLKASRIEDVSSDEDDTVLEKQKKPKKQTNWVFTPAREAAFNKAKELRSEKAAAKRAAEEEKKSKFEQEKAAKLAKKEAKLKKKQEEELKALETSSDEEEVVIKKKPKQKKTKIVYESSDDDSEDDSKRVRSKKQPVNIVINNETKPAQPVQQLRPRPMPIFL